MKTRWVTFSLTLLLAAAALVTPVRHVRAEGPRKQDAAAGARAAKITYACPMDPGVVSDEPGKCPKCGMFLEAVPSERVFYACPMHPEVTSDKPGKCSKCGMGLEKRTEKIAYVYSCPMHPEVKQDSPGKCPKCGMYLAAHVAETASKSKSVAPVR